MSFLIREIRDEDRAWVKSTLAGQWGAALIITRGIKHQADKLPGFIAHNGNEKIGLITFNIINNECEIITLNSFVRKHGIATALIERVKQAAREETCKRLWVITTNDNTYALRFYQKREFNIKTVYTNSIVESRKLKPAIPFFGIDDIPIRDEIELELIF